jgi:hypothetical protein
MDSRNADEWRKQAAEARQHAAEAPDCEMRTQWLEIAKQCETVASAIDALGIDQTALGAQDDAR